METLSICLISKDFPPRFVGGQGVYTYEIAKRLSEKGYDIKVIASSEGLRNENFELLSVNETIDPLHFSFLAKKKFAKKIHKEIDILHGNAIDHLFFCFKKPKNVIKIVTTSHNTYLQRFLVKNTYLKIVYPFYIGFEKIVSSYSEQIIAVSQITRDFLCRYSIPNSKIHVIYNGVDTEKFRPGVKMGFLRTKLNLSEFDKIVLFVGRLVKRKNPHIILMACRELVKESPDIHCVFVGRGSLETKLRGLAKTYKIAKNTHFLGFVSDENLPEIYRDSNTFVLPSVGEGLPFTLLEAAASGLPLVATEDATGRSPIIRHGVNGFVIKPYDVKDLIQRIRLSLKYQDKMGENSRKIVLKYFTWEKCLEKIIQIYKTSVN